MDTVAFDKTGTLTVGQPQLTATHTFDNWSEPQLLAAVAAVQRGSEHPLARAVVQAAAARSDVTVTAASDVRAIPGRGTEGHIADTALLIGSLRWMQELGADLSKAISLAESLQSAGATISAVATRDPAAGSAPRIVGLLAFGDEPKPGATEALSRLRASGLRLRMISVTTVVPRWQWRRVLG